MKEKFLMTQYLPQPYPLWCGWVYVSPKSGLAKVGANLIVAWVVVVDGEGEEAFEILKPYTVGPPDANDAEDNATRLVALSRDMALELAMTEARMDPRFKGFQLTTP